MIKRIAQYAAAVALLIALGTAVGCTTYGSSGNNGGMYPTPGPMPMPSTTS